MGKEMTRPEAKTPAEAETTAAPDIEEAEAVARVVNNLLEAGLDIDSDGWNLVAPGLRSAIAELGNGGVILVLYETPSGFAIFTYDGLDLPLTTGDREYFLDGEMADSAVWLKEFQTFEDKASAINPVTGVNEQLATMIRNHIVPDQKLAVGKLEYKHIIEDKLGIACLFDDTVVELMWGLKNCMHHLLPGEKGELSKENRRHMSQGMKIVLDRFINLKSNQRWLMR
ncbi:hypothetical protein BS78_07G028000 [Paspalum vaginatum]|nr:hypothetical protein BS78_07G028000 [Paspalum vaginatum]